MKTLHLIGNAHLDPVWLWEWGEGLDAVRATFRAQLGVIADTPGYKFVCSSSGYYEWLEQTDPATFEEVRAAVKAGRIVPVGGWYIQPEGNTGGGESFARLGLYGQTFSLSRFGKKCGGGYLPDTFGQNGNMPALLRGAELNYHVFMRPPNWGLPLPQAHFRWVGVNGESIETYRIAAYAFGGFVAGDEGATGAVAKHIDRTLATLGEHMDWGMVFYGVGNHGGGPTRRVIAELMSGGQSHARSKGYELIFSDPDAYFAEARPRELPEHRGGIQKISIGCYANWNRVKRAIRHAERSLFEAEALACAAAALSGGKLSSLAAPGAFEPLWKHVLFTLFHDMATGTSIAPVEADALRRMAAVEAETDRRATLAAAALAQRLDTRPPESLASTEAGGRSVQAVVLVNALPGEQSLPVDLELVGVPAAFRVVDGAGTELATQELHPRASAFNEAHGRRRFLVRLPGERPNAEVLFVAPAPRGQAAPVLPRPSVAKQGVLRGGAAELWWDADKGPRAFLIGGRECLRTGEPWAFNLLDDDSDSWGHSKRTLTELILHYDLFRARLPHLLSEVVEAGPLRQTLRSRYVGGAAQVELFTSVLAGFDGLLMEARLSWRGRYEMLKFSFHTTLAEPLVARAKVPFCFERVEADGREVPAQEWVHLAGTGDGGLALVTDTTYSYSIRGPIVDATLLRSVPYAYDFNTELGDRRDAVEVTDQGEHVFRCLLAPGSFDPPRLERLARNLLRPPRVVREFEHGPAGGAPAEARHAAWLSCDHPAIGICALKRTEADDGYAVRLVELAGKPAAGTLRFTGHEAKVELAPLAIATLVLRDDGRTERTSFLEGV